MLFVQSDTIDAICCYVFMQEFEILLLNLVEIQHILEVSPDVVVTFHLATKVHVCWNHDLAVGRRDQLQLYVRTYQI